jgi:hypothetical protein
MTLQYTHYSDNIDPKFGGYAIGPYVRIRPKYKNDVGLHVHEYEHVNQFWIGTILSAILIYIGLYVFKAPYDYYPVLFASLGAHGNLYKFYEPYKVYCEVVAYSKQLRVYGDKVVPEWVIRALTTKYGLSITRQEVIDKIQARL